MGHTLLRLSAAVVAVTLFVTAAGTATRAYAEGPADFSGIGELGQGLDGVGELGAAAQPPAAAVEQPATGTTGASAPAPASLPTGNAAPAALALPNTGTGSSGGGSPLLALVAALAGVACVGVAFKLRAEGVRA